MERRFALIKHTHFLSDLADFSVSSPADGDVLEYDSSTSKWVNVTVASLGGLAEAVQDLAGAALTDTTSVNFTYTDGTGLITADVLPAGVDHDSLLNYVADKHVAHSGVTMTAGAGLTGGGDISATRTFAVGAGTGITVNADDVALSAATIASLASIPAAANPSASIGLTAVNGSATTFLRSDGAPPLSQAIAPTWTQPHIYSASAGALLAGWPINLTSGNPGLQWRNTGSALNAKSWDLRVSGNGLIGNTWSDDYLTNSEWIRFTRSGVAVTSINLGALADATQVLISDGSTSAPSLAFMSSVNTGMNSISGGIAWSLGGNSVMKVTGGPAAFTYLTLTSPAGQQAALRLTQTSTADWINYIPSSSTNLVWYSAGDRMLLSAAGELAIGAVGSASVPSISLLSDANTGIYWPAADQLGFSEGGTGYRIGYRDIPRRTSGFARGEALAISAGVTLNTSDMAAGYAFTVYNDSASAITITQGSGVTLRLAGGATTGNRTLAARGIATIWCNSGTEAVISGAGVT